MTILYKNQSAGKKLKILLQKPFYLFFFACYPIVFMFSNNKTEIQGWMIIRPLIISLFLMGIVYLLARLGFRSSRKGAFFTLVFLVLFFSYGQIYHSTGKRAILDRANHPASLSTPAGVDDFDRYLLARYKKGYIRSYHPIEYNHLGSVGYPNG